MKPRVMFAVAIVVAALSASSRVWAFGLNDVLQQHHDGISDSLIVRQIEQSGHVFRLSSQDFRKLKQAGVSDQVMSALVMTDRPIPARVPYGPSPYVHFYVPYGPYPFHSPYYYRPGFSLGLSFGYRPYYPYRYPYHYRRW